MGHHINTSNNPLIFVIVPKMTLKLYIWLDLISECLVCNQQPMHEQGANLDNLPPECGEQNKQILPPDCKLYNHQT